jgi:hypothetical protein
MASQDTFPSPILKKPKWGRWRGAYLGLTLQRAGRQHKHPHPTLPQNQNFGGGEGIGYNSLINGKFPQHPPALFNRITRRKARMKRINSSVLSSSS